MSQRKKGSLYLTGVNHMKAHYTQLKDCSGIRVGTMKNVAVGTNLRIYHWTIKQSCSAGNGTHWTHVPWCVQSHVKTQLTFWQRPPFCFHSPFSAPVPAYPVCGLCCDLAPYLRGSDYHIHVGCIEGALQWLFGWREGKRGDMDDTGKVGSESADISKVRGVAAVLRPHGHVACRHVLAMTFPLFVSGGCLAPGLGWVRARGQPHQTLGSHLSIFPHCAQRWQLAFSCL